jgi:DNA-binding phage protein
MPEHTPPLDSLESIAAHLAGAFDSGDPALITAALSAVACAPAAGELAAAAGFPRADFGAALGSGELDLSMVLSIMKVVDLHR